MNVHYNIHDLLFSVVSRPDEEEEKGLISAFRASAKSYMVQI